MKGRNLLSGNLRQWIQLCTFFLKATTLQGFSEHDYACMKKRKGMKDLVLEDEGSSHAEIFGYQWYWILG